MPRFGAPHPPQDWNPAKADGLVSQPSTTSSVVAVVVPESGAVVTGDFQSRRVNSVSLNGRARDDSTGPWSTRARCTSRTTPSGT
ncbi:hypothetical protein [Nonomuraea jabiensis]|uniref:Uncharacterized protein n=1 Tax=Nonomuraea jabiensis TaxID=882448 RepID=A0A7W9FXS3_9ACTN|nr:hypothetical protein [Nonomuraea jabiensis]MBB5773527.1 hypothetical protein [Nonomuraea jabiensis]